MFQKFNTNTIESKFIKNLVATTYTPLVQIWKPGKPIHSGFTYISKNYILKCVRTYNPVIDGSGPQSENDANYFDIVEPYIREKFYPGLTTNHISSNSEYDSKTHYYLGQYLRYQRDINDLDLMAYYNCWCGEYSDSIRIRNLSLTEKATIYTGEVISDNKNQDGYKLLKIPIKYNQKYTIFINSNTPFIIGYLYCNGDVILNKKAEFKYINRCSFEDPYLYDGVSNLIETSGDTTVSSDSEYIYENYLTMIIQLPVTTSNKILILEGDYKNNKLVSWYKTANINIERIVNKNWDFSQNTQGKDLYQSIGWGKFVKTFDNWYINGDADTEESDEDNDGINCIVKSDNLITMNNQIWLGSSLGESSKYFGKYLHISVPVEYLKGVATVCITPTNVENTFTSANKLIQQNHYNSSANFDLTVYIPSNLDWKYLNILLFTQKNTEFKFKYVKVEVLDSYLDISKDDVYINQINNPEIIYGDKLSYIDNYDINKECMIIPSLTRKIKDSTYAFSDRLIEYLLLNVIDNKDGIYQNIDRIQKYASSTINKEFNDSIYTESYVKGEWDNKLRKYLYNLTTKNIKTPITVDISGYVDKDVETIITRGQNV